jgi:tetratricopeptide (TPR) repeat protein
MMKLTTISVPALLLIMCCSGWAQLDSSEVTRADEFHELCKSLYARCDYDEAIKCGKKATEIDTTNSDYYLWLGIAYSEKTKEGWFLKKLSNARKSKRAFERGVELDPASLDAREGVLEYYVRAPGIAGGGKDKAENQAGEISKVDPVRGHLAYAYIYRYEEDFSRAEDELILAIETDPGFAEPYFRLAGLYVDQKKYDKAEATLIKALENSLDTAVTLYQLGWLYQSRDDFQRAAEVFEQIKESTPGDMRALFYLANIYLHQQNYLRADEIISEIHKANPDCSCLNYLMAHKALLTGAGLEKGIEYLEKYIEANPQESYNPCWAYTHLMSGIKSYGPGWACACMLKGQLHEAMGKRKQARKDYEMALKYDPCLAKAQDALDRL